MPSQTYLRATNLATQIHNSTSPEQLSTFLSLLTRHQHTHSTASHALQKSESSLRVFQQKMRDAWEDCYARERGEGTYEEMLESRAEAQKWKRDVEHHARGVEAER
ncbi:hypothetical protein P7C71_g2723, partial [Lecanoromycetidae sp. Uapishka_2]